MSMDINDPYMFLCILQFLQLSDILNFTQSSKKNNERIEKCQRFQSAKKIRFFLKLNSSLTSRIFRDDIDYLPPNALPSYVTVIKFGNNFNQPLDELPAGLKRLKFGYRFNQPVDELPAGLKRLQFGDSFDQPVDKLPQALIKLKFGDDFNQRVDKLPAGLEELDFGRNFNQPVKKLPQV